MPSATVRVPSQLPRVSQESTNDESDNEMIPGAVYRSPGIYLTAEENSRKPQLKDRLMKRMCHRSSTQMGYFSSIRDPLDRTARQEWIRKERGKGRMGM